MELKKISLSGPIKRTVFINGFCGLLLSLLIFLSLAPVVRSQDVIAEHGMVASAHPLASSAGNEILKKGGNAVDAAVATAFALAVVEPNASGLGGGGFMVIKMANEKDAITIDYRESAPAAATSDFYYQTKESFSEYTRFGPNSVGVPGVVKGLALALEKYGSMSLEEVVEPAVRLGKEGFLISEKFAGMILQKYELILENPSTANIYLVENMPPEPGTLLKNPDLAKTMERLAKEGADLFYKGELGKTIAGKVAEKNGILKLSDLQNYKVEVKKPVFGSYRGYEIISSAPPSGGGTHLVEILNILEGYDFNKIEHNSAAYIHILSEAMKMIFADKSANMADPDFYKVPVEKLTDKAYAKKLQSLIGDKARFDYKPPHLVSRESSSTTHLSVIDQNNNLVALTQSINFWFGSGIMVDGTGIILNNHLSDFENKPGKPNSIEPNKRPVSSIAPTILLKDGKPFLTIGTPGGSRIISALCQIIVNIIDFEMSIDEAIEAPRIHAYGKTLNLEGRIPEEIATQLEAMGHKVKIREDFDNYFGGAQGILVHPVTDKKHGGADSRRDGVAIGF